MYHPVSLATKSYQEHSHGMCVHPKKRRLKKDENKRNRKETKETKMKQKRRCTRAQAESRGDKVAVCWYDQSYDMSS